MVGDGERPFMRYHPVRPLRNFHPQRAMSCMLKSKPLKVNVLSMDGFESSPNAKKGKQVLVQVARVLNCTIGDYNGQVGVGLYKNGEFVKTLVTMDVALNQTRIYRNLQFTPVIPNNLSGKGHQLVMVSKDNNDTQWRPILTAGVGCIDLEIKGNDVKLKPNSYDRYIDLGSLSAKQGKKDIKSQNNNGKSITNGIGDVDADDFYGK